MPENDKSDTMIAPNSPFPDGIKCVEFPFVDDIGALIELVGGVTLRINP